MRGRCKPLPLTWFLFYSDVFSLLPCTEETSGEEEEEEEEGDWVEGPADILDTCESTHTLSLLVYIHTVTPGPHLTSPPPQLLMPLELPRPLTWQRQGNTT